MEGDLIKIHDWLLPLSWLYGAGVRLRNWLFNVGLLHQQRTELFAAHQHTVIDRFQQRSLESFFLRKIALDNTLDLSYPFFHQIIKIRQVHHLHS